LNPHLLSVAAAADKIDNEHTRFVDCRYYGASADLPFFPLRLIAQGSVPKSDGRARPVQYASMPRDELFYINGEPVSLSTSSWAPDGASATLPSRPVSSTWRSRSTMTRLLDDCSTAALYRWLKQARTLVPGRWGRRRRHTSTRPHTAFRSRTLPSVGR